MIREIGKRPFAVLFVCPFLREWLIMLFSFSVFFGLSLDLRNRSYEAWAAVTSMDLLCD